MIDGPAHAFELAGDYVLGHVTGHVDGVGSESTDHPVSDTELGGDHEEFVVAFETVDLDYFDVVVANVEACAEDAFDADHDVIGELGAKDHDLVETGTAIDGNRGIDVVSDLVFAAACADV